MTYDTINDAATMQCGGAGALLAGRYRIVRQLGQGGMGSVWLAEDTQLDGKQFAIKMLPSILLSNKRAYRQLKGEAIVSMRLTHPNIVTLRAFEENNGNPFLVMDYIDGQTLDDYLCERGTGNGERGSGLSEEEAIRVLRPIAAALDYAHGEGVVHRDVKPANVMIRKDGHPFILDFGIAREIQETLTRVTGKLSSGTLLYMSPEQLNGAQPKKEQDIYSFAAMTYECLKGEPPFVRGAIEDQIRNRRPDPPPGGTQLVASVMAGLAKEPEDRPKTCAAVLEGDVSRRDAEAQSGGTDALRPSQDNGGARRPAEPQNGDDFSHKGEHKERKGIVIGKPHGEYDRLERSNVTSVWLGIGTAFVVLLACAGIVHWYNGQGGVGYRAAARQEARTTAEDSARRAKSEAELAMSKAKQQDAERVCPAGWAEARTAWFIGTAEFDRHEYDNAQLTFERASGLFWRCAEQAKRSIDGNADEAIRKAAKEKEEEARRIAQAQDAARQKAEADEAERKRVEEAARRQREEELKRALAAQRRAEEARRIEQAKTAARKEAEAAEAERRKAEEARRRKDADAPKVFLTATLNGVQKSALITEGLKESGKHRTPLAVNITSPIGAQGSFAVEYLENGEKYVGRIQYTVRKGTQNIGIALVKEPEKRFPRPKTMNFCRHCGCSLKEYITVGVKCPTCGKNLFGK